MYEINSKFNSIEVTTDWIGVVFSTYGSIKFQCYEKHPILLVWKSIDYFDNRFIPLKIAALAAYRKEYVYNSSK